MPLFGSTQTLLKVFNGYQGPLTKNQGINGEQDITKQLMVN